MSTIRQFVARGSDSVYITRRMPINSTRLFQLLTCLCATLGSERLAAQAPRTTTLDFATGSEYEDYLRTLQVAGLLELNPWSIRGFSPAQITRMATADSAGPWTLRANFRAGNFTIGSLNAGTAINTSYPYGGNDGPVWSGRGITLVASGGIAGRLGPLSFSLSPKGFLAGNSAFSLLANGKSGELVFSNGSFPNEVDYPQRFGGGSYSRLDPDASSVRFDSRFLSLGVSTGNEWIGPATEHPFLLGTNAPGFPHLFIGTGSPVNLWIARVQSRVMWGKLYQSDYSPVPASPHFVSSQEPGAVRLMAASQIAVVPRGIPGLEIGFARFLHVPNRERGPGAEFWRKPFKVFFLENEFAAGDSAGADNQLASAFFRWVFPRNGFEVYGERGYEDHFYDMRDLIQNPDNEREYMLGFQKTFRKPTRALDVLKVEMVNYQLPSLARVRLQGLVYLHGTLRQGHTHRGQLLGSSAGVGAAAASTISWSRYSSRGRTSFVFRRIVRDERGNDPENGILVPFPNGDVVPSRASDIIVSAGVERMRFGRRVDYGAKAEMMQNFNRNFAKDAANLNLQLTARLHSW